MVNLVVVLDDNLTTGIMDPYVHMYVNWRGGG